MTAILLLHGPNLNLLGRREPDVYGARTLADINALFVEAASRRDTQVRAVQANSEGTLIDELHDREPRGL